MNDLVYPRERTLGTITLVIGVLIWLALIIGTFGIALLGLALGFVLYLFTQSAFIAYIKGNGVELSEEQFPDLHAQFVECCERLQVNPRPKVYILHGGGGLNAFATKFLGTQFVVLLSDVVDAMDKHADGVRFYIGHELGHLRMKHLSGSLLRWPALALPLLGAAYSRARETTCDRHGLACCSSSDGAARALAALSAGAERWQQLDVGAYLRQAQQSAGFWMSFHELIGAYPWLTTRVARVTGTEASLPRRHSLSYLLALFVPHAGRLGAGFGVLMMVYIVGVLAALAIPAYLDYNVRAKVATAVHQTQPAREALVARFRKTKKVPQSLAAAGIEETLADGSSLSLDPDGMILTVSLKEGELVLTPSVDDEGKISWSCSPGERLKPEQMPADCRSKSARGEP